MAQWLAHEMQTSKIKQKIIKCSRMLTNIPQREMVVRPKSDTVHTLLHSDRILDLLLLHALFFYQYLQYLQYLQYTWKHLIVFIIFVRFFFFSFCIIFRFDIFSFYVDVAICLTKSYTNFTLRMQQIVGF